MSDRISSLLAHLSRRADSVPSDEPLDLHWLEGATDAEVSSLLAGLSALPPAVIDRAGLAAVLRQVVRRLQPWAGTSRRRLVPAATAQAIGLYRSLGPGIAVRCYLLQLLSASAGEVELKAFVQLMVADPPSEPASVMLAMGPLFQHTDYRPEMLFPALLESIAHPVVATSVLDLANFLARQRGLSPHPAYERRSQLAALLGSVVQRLQLMEVQPDKFATSGQPLAQQIDESIALAVSLCDALALIGDPQAIGKLYQALDVRHRRLHAEAAAALARLGEEAGRVALLALANEPVARLRVLAYCDELGLTDRLDECHRTALARAESELALWLSQPAQMGLPPTRLELVDSRTQYWPGFDEPIECFLLRFDYQVGTGTFSNVGIAGPVTHAFAADLQDLAPDDIYAVFAGWHAEHEEIYERDVDELTEAQRVDVARLERRLRDGGFESIRPALLGSFLGDLVLIAHAAREGHAGVAVVDARDSVWLPVRNLDRPLAPHEAFSLYKGRRLLRSFN